MSTGSPAWPVTLERFLVTPDGEVGYLTPATLQISAVDAVETLHATTLTIISDVLRGVFFRPEINKVWQTGCSVLVHGGPKLMAVALEMLTHIVDLGGFPERQAHRFFPAYLHVLDMLSTAAQADLIVYGTAFRELSRRVFVPERDVHLRFERVHLSMLMVKLQQLLLGGILEELDSEEVKTSLCETFEFLLGFVPLGYECAGQIRKERVNDICRALIAKLGLQRSQQVSILSNVTGTSSAGKHEYAFHSYSFALTVSTWRGTSLLLCGVSDLTSSKRTPLLPQSPLEALRAFL